MWKVLLFPLYIRFNKNKLIPVPLFYFIKNFFDNRKLLFRNRRHKSQTLLIILMCFRYYMQL